MNDAHLQKKQKRSHQDQDLISSGSSSAIKTTIDDDMIQVECKMNEFQSDLETCLKKELAYQNKIEQFIQKLETVHPIKKKEILEFLALYRQEVQSLRETRKTFEKQVQYYNTKLQQLKADRDADVHQTTSPVWEGVSTLAQLSYESTFTCFLLDTNYLAQTGLTSEKLVLYCRPTFHEQFKFLREKVIDQGVLAWILGPPGTGKSTTALSFASTLDRKQWVVTWIHLSRDKFPVCVRLEGDVKKSCEFSDSKVDELVGILNGADKSRRHIVFLDGLAFNVEKHTDIQKICYSWLEKDRERRRLVVVSSMSSRYKAKKHEDMILNLEEFYVYSWKEDEYIQAIRNEDFYNNVKSVLDADLPVESNSTTPEDLVRSKLYFAGASARWMFLYSTQDVIDCIHESVAKVLDVIPYVQGTIGDQSDHVLNRLFSLSRDEDRNIASIISRYTAVQLAIKVGPDLICRLAEVTRQDSNPSMKGWMLEMWFFASLRKGGVTLLNEDNTTYEHWPESKVKTVDLSALPSTDTVWLKPKKWNQGGYDAIYLDKSLGLNRFVQVTRANKHSFKVEYFRKFLELLPESFVVCDLEIIFLVHEEKKAVFKVDVPSKSGQFSKYGWESGKELDQGARARVLRVYLCWYV